VENGASLEFKLLGPLEVRNRGTVLALGGPKQRALLALLLLHVNEVVSRDRLIDGLWGESSPPSAGHRLETQISRLRKTLVLDGRLATRLGGYVLEVDPMRIDAYRFERLLEEGRRQGAAGRASAAADTLREALSLWRGGALADLAYEPFARLEIERLEELRLAAIEERIDADLVLGGHEAVIAELETLTAQHPLRERLRGQLMLALYRCGRQAEALAVFQQFRRGLAEQLGLDPGPGLQQLELAILRRDPTLDPPDGARAPDPPRAPSQAPLKAAGSGRRRLTLALGGLVLLALALVGGIVASGGGGAAALRDIPGDAVGAISASGGAVEAAVPLESSPSVLAAGDGAVWVANSNAGTVSRIDPATRAVVETIPVGAAPSGIAAGGGAVWVANNYDGTVSRVDPTVDRVVQTIAVGNAPTGVAVGDGSVWVANSSDGTLSRIDALSGSVTDTVALGGAGATDAAVGAGAVWVSDEAGDRVLRVDPQADQVTASINVGSGPTAIAVGFGSVWVANSLDGTVSRIDPGSDTISATITAGDGPAAIAVGSGAVWVADQYAGTVSRIDPGSDTVARTITVGSPPQGLAIAAGLVWVGARSADTSHRGGTLNTLSSTWVDTVDPVLATGAAGPLEMTNDGLTAYQRVGGSGSVQIVPDLAVSLPSPTDGGTTYTFQLRQGIRYSNGELVRPGDFRRALERDLILGPNPMYGDPFADVIGGAACAAHPGHCDLSRGVVTDDAANTVTFHLAAPDPEFLDRLTLTDAVAVPAGTPLHDIGLHPLPATGPYMWTHISRDEITLVRNPYFHEWSHAAQPDGYPDRIVYRLAANPEAEITAIEHGSADYTFDQPPPDRINELQTRFASQLHVSPSPSTDELVLNTRVAPFTDVRVRRALNYAIDRAKIARLLGPYNQPSCQTLPPYLPGYRPYCPYTLDPNPAGVWHVPNLAEAKQLIDASPTRGTPITIWNLGGQNDYTTIEPYLVSLLDQLGYPTTVKNVSTDPNAPLRFADSRTGAQAALTESNPWYPSASQIIQVNFACQSFLPNSTGNANLSEFCDHRLDAQIATALTAESDNSPDIAALWAQADRTVTEQAPVVPLAIPSNIEFVSPRVGNYQYSFQVGTLLDQLWLR